ncbi:hypothetical protein ACKC9G_12065 [Pokkaliibacter sp. CJK22405]|uniref:hypothetical protein n=1 Tax=Pokkaliibacter sp. CJK22405 TaxID=3384615 RepID=UPI003984FA4B
MMFIDVVVQGLFCGLALWISGRLIRAEIGFLAAVMASAITTLISYWLPMGWLLYGLVLCISLKLLSDVRIWPDMVLLVLVGWLVSFALSGLLVAGLVAWI